MAGAQDKLLLHDHTPYTTQALKAAGFAVQPLVGDIKGGWNMSWYRDTFTAKAFASAAVEEIEAGGLEGLNFDYEPHQPGNGSDASAYMAMVQTIANRTKASAGVQISVCVCVCVCVCARVCGWVCTRACVCARVRTGVCWGVGTALFTQRGPLTSQMNGK